MNTTVRGGRSLLIGSGALAGVGSSLLYRAAVRVLRLPPPIPSEQPAPVPPPVRHRVLILGGGFAGATTAQHLEQRFGDDDSVAITLVSSDNQLLFTPM